MQVLQAPFSDFVIPDPSYTGFLLAGTVIIIAILYVLRPPITQMLVLAFTPWMITGAGLHVFYLLGERFQRQVFPPIIEPLFSAPAVYLTTFLMLGSVWIVSVILGGSTRSSAEDRDYIAQYLGSTGVGITITIIALLVWQGLDPQLDLEPFLPVISVIATMILTFVIYVMIGAWRTYIIAETRVVGLLVLFAHLLDGISTAIGRDVLGITERSAVPARIMEFAGDLPTAPYIGEGWLFLVVKLLLAVVIVILFADLVSEDPDRGNLFLAFVVALGLGPAMNNLFLFMLGLP